MDRKEKIGKNKSQFMENTDKTGKLLAWLTQ